MTLYLSGMAALDVMRYVRAVNDGKIPGRVPRPRRLEHAIHSNSDLNGLNHSAHLMLSHVRGKIEALVPVRTMGTETSKIKTHLWSHNLPFGAFIDLGNGIYLSSPPFLFVQLAPSLSLVDLIMVGMELCGYYSQWRLPSRSTFGNVEIEDTTFNLESATSASRLKRFIGRLSNERGLAGARDASKYVLDHAASRMETAVYLLLCLPRRMGGFGFPKPILNAEVKVTTSTTHEKRYPDLYWPAHELDVEYQSDYAHSGDWSRYKDSRRAVELEAESVTVLPLTRYQLMDANEFKAFATSVRRNLHQRSRPLSGEWWSKYLDLRQAVLKGA